MSTGWSTSSTTQRERVSSQRHLQHVEARASLEWLRHADLPVPAVPRCREVYVGLVVVKARAAPRWPAASLDNSHDRRGSAFSEEQQKGGQAVQIGLFWIPEPTMHDPSSERSRRVLQARMAAHALHAKVS